MTRTTIDSDERSAYLALAQTPGLSARGLAALLSEYGSPIGVLSAPIAFSGHMTPVARKAITAARKLLTTIAEFEEAARSKGITILTPADEAFPAKLRSIPDPPLVLYATGHLELLRRPAVAIVGSRDHTAYGLEVTRAIAGKAAVAGIVVVSGMARGLDAVAHQAALDAHGATIGVLGNGIGVIYPRLNKRLYESVEREGLLITEHPPGEGPFAWAFPRRNRLISGLAQVLVVAEAAQGSGTMLTVAAALEQGRDVMAVPGPITSNKSDGTNQLLRDGAEPLLSIDDLLARFAIAPFAKANEMSLPLNAPPCTLSPEEARVFDALTLEGRHIDDLTEAVGLPVGLTLSVLCGLELGGLVDQTAGNCFRRVVRAG
jgi:DNA processing protein